MGLPAAVYRAKGLLVLASIARPVIFQMTGRRTNPFEVAPPPRAAPAPRPRRRQARMQAVAAEGGTKLVLVGRGACAGQCMRGRGGLGAPEPAGGAGGDLLPTRGCAAGLHPRH